MLNDFIYMFFLIFLGFSIACCIILIFKVLHYFFDLLEDYFFKEYDFSLYFFIECHYGIIFCIFSFVGLFVFGYLYYSV